MEDRTKTNQTESQRRCKASSSIVVAAVVVVATLFFAGSAAFFANIAKKHHRGDSAGSNSDTKQQGNDYAAAEWKALRNVLIEELSPTIDPEIFLKLSQPASVEWKALQWLVIKDHTDATTTMTTTSWMQRYALTVTYLHFDLLTPLHTTLHECAWMGVTCRNSSNDSVVDGTNVVTALNFTGQALPAGTIPTSLAYISSSLESLDFSAQGLQGTIPAACYAEWKNLVYLNLEQNQLTQIFTGVVAAADSSMNTTWNALRYLNAKNNLLAESVPASLSGWTNLRALDLSGNAGLTGPLLEYALPHWTEIESIDITQTGITGTIPDNLFLPHLTTLAASSTPLSGSLPESLVTATNLETLALGFLELTSPWTGTLPDAYSALTALKFVSLVSLEGITGTLPDSWGYAWSKVSALDLFGNPMLTGPLPSSWGHMTELVVLRLSDTGISGSIPSELGLLTNLVDLSFYRTQLSGSMPQEVCELRTQHFLSNLAVDCASSSSEAADARVQCSSPECCSLCVRSQRSRDLSVVGNE